MSENVLASDRMMISSVNGLPIPMPEVIDNSPDNVLGGQTQQEKLDARFFGQTATENGKLFLTPSDHAAMERDEKARASRASGATISMGVSSSPHITFSADAKKADKAESLAKARAAKAEKAAAVES